MSRDADDDYTMNRAEIGQQVTPTESHAAGTLSNGLDFSLLSLNEEDVELLSQSDGFSILRSHLAEHYLYQFCDTHSEAHGASNDRWILVRDILHALLVPVVELFDKACGLASSITHATRLEDLEHAFTGQARSAFVWLQCFLCSEQELDWCYTRGCPACVVDHALDSEFTIRLLYAACLLSDVHYPFTLEGPTLPSFMFFLESLKRSIAQDDLYGEAFLELMEPKAAASRDGIEDLIHQCVGLDAMLSQPGSPELNTPDGSLPTTPIVGPMGGEPGMKVKRSRMARRQMKLKMEEEQWMEDLLRKCWEQLQSENDSDLIPVTTEALNPVLNAGHTVSVAPVAPE